MIGTGGVVVGACDEVGRSAGCDIAIDRAWANEGYFIGRMSASVARAAASADSLARLVHYELAGRYAVAALAASRPRGPV